MLYEVITQLLLHHVVERRVRAGPIAVRIVAVPAEVAARVVGDLVPRPRPVVEVHLV